MPPQTKTMKAALLEQLGKPLVIAQVPWPELGPHEVLVATHTCGICGTDLHICQGLAYVPRLPHIPGHEPAGVVAALGSKVTGIEVGQRVVPHLFFTCGRCRACRVGDDAQCLDLQGLLGVLNPGAFAEYFKVPAENLLPLPDEVSFAVGGLIADAVLTALHASRRAQLAPGDTAVVIGAGGVGQVLIQILREAGLRLAAVDRSYPKLRIASDLGAELLFAAADFDANRARAAVGELAQSDGAACVFDCVGSAATTRMAAALARRGGQIVVIGEEPEDLGINTIELAQRELRIVGSRNGTRQDMRDAIALVAAGRVVPRIAECFPLEHINAALDCLRRGEALGRIVIQIR